MPIAKIQAPDGRIITLEVPQGATNEQIMSFLQQNPPKVADQDTRPQLQMAEPGIGEQIAGGLENVASFATGALAEPIAGIAGGLAALNPFAEEGAGARTVEAVRSALTTTPQTQAGQEQQQAIGEALAPVGESIQAGEEFLGTKTLEATGSPVLASIAHTLPTAILELLGIKGSGKLTKVGGKPTRRQIKKAVVESAPEVRQLRQAAGTLFDEISQSGIKVKDNVTRRLAGDIKKDLIRQGFNRTNNPSVAGLIREIDDVSATGADLSRLQILRKTASNIAEEVNAIGKSTPSARLGTRAINRIDDFFDSVKPNQFVGGSQTAANTAKKLKAANKLWGRAARAENIENAIIRGSERAAGAEAGIRNELRRIINNKRSSKFIPKDELDAMKSVVKGNFSQNLTKLIGKVGLSVDQSPNVFQSIVAGGGLGAVLGGPTGAVAIPTVGTISKQIAKNLTTKRAKFLSTMTRAGNDAERIAKAYLSSVPKNKRRVSDLADLLSDPQVDISVLEGIANQTIKDALDIAKGRRQINLAVGAGVGASAPRSEEE